MYDRGRLKKHPWRVTINAESTVSMFLHLKREREKERERGMLVLDGDKLIQTYRYVQCEVHLSYSRRKAFPA
jgi:ERCC4-type nuclease